MASKLSAKMKAVEDALDEIIKPIVEYLKYRIQLSTLVEIVIPKALADGSANGATLNTWQRTADDLRTKMDNCRQWVLHYIGVLEDACQVLEAHVKQYKPDAMKKPQLMDDDRIEAREKKKKAAIALIKKCTDQIKDHKKTLSV